MDGNLIRVMYPKILESKHFGVRINKNIARFFLFFMILIFFNYFYEEANTY